jgi:hypothetical protein
MRRIPAAFMAALGAVVAFGNVGPARAAGPEDAGGFVCDAEADGGIHPQPQGFGSPSPTLEAAEQSALGACELDSAPGLGSTCRLTCTPANAVPYSQAPRK